MNRYTKRTPIGEVAFDYPSYCYFSNGKPDRLAIAAFEREALYRLAEYEDTGLEPEEMEELARAQADGRLVTLPCNFKALCERYGDAIYIVKEGEIFEGVLCSIGFDIDGELRCEAVYGPPTYAYGEVEFVGLSFGLSDFDESVFFDSFQAEKALEGAQV